MSKEYCLNEDRETTSSDGGSFKENLLQATEASRVLVGGEAFTNETLQPGAGADILIHQVAGALTLIHDCTTKYEALADKYLGHIEVTAPASHITGLSTPAEGGDTAVSVYGELDPTSVDLVNGILTLNDFEGKLVQIEYGSLPKESFSVIFPHEIFLSDRNEAEEIAAQIGQTDIDSVTI